MRAEDWRAFIEASGDDNSRGGSCCETRDRGRGAHAGCLHARVADCESDEDGCGVRRRRARRCAARKRGLFAFS